MITSAVLCTWVLLAVTSLAMAGVPMASNLAETPECDLTSKELKKLKDLTIKDFDADDMLTGSFTELWSTQFMNKVMPYCLKNYVKRSVENDMLQQITIVKNVNTNDQKETIQFLQKLERNVFLVRRSGDSKPVARIYVIFANQNAVGVFQCAIERQNAFKHIFQRMTHIQNNEQVNGLPDDTLPQKMAVIAVPQSAIKFPLPASVETPLNQAWEIINKNQDLFGIARETEPCILVEGDIEKNQVN